ncbi:PHP14 phosphatase, partial [Polyodon spathula]|nr:PHP14 phosphatase [Polyodon spathula]
MADNLSNVSAVEIDPEGVFKYILVRVKAKGGADEYKDIVRGTKNAEFHSPRQREVLANWGSNECPFTEVSDAGYLSLSLSPGTFFLPRGCSPSHNLHMCFRLLGPSPLGCVGIAALNHIFEKIKPDLEKLGLECNCLGGGKIEHNSTEKKIRVFGLSTGFGKADHSVAVEKLKAVFTDYEITWSDDKK